MKKYLALVMSCLLSVGVVGCGSAPKSAETLPRIKTTEKLNIKSFALTLVQGHTPDIEYHTEAELQTKALAGIKEKLAQDNLLTDQPNANSIEMKVTYYRAFVGDATPIPSDSLAYPGFEYEIIIKDGEKILTTVSKPVSTYHAGFLRNLQVMSGTLRAKEDEIPFIDNLSTFVANSIKDIK